MGRGTVLEYDDDVLVEMLAGGRYTHAEIAGARGLSEAYVGKVARGERRPKLHRQVEARQAAMIAEARRVGARWSRALVSRHIEVGLTGDDETARKCRELVLQECCFKRGLTAPEPPGRPGGWQRPLDEEPDDDPL